MIRAHGKASIPLVLAFFCTARVEAYPIFDLDRDHDEDDWRGSIWVENAILSLLGLPAGEELSGTVIDEHFACWTDDFGSLVREEIGDVYVTHEREVSDELGYRGGSGRKVGRVVQDCLQKCYADGHRSAAVDNLITVLRSRLG